MRLCTRCHEWWPADPDFFYPGVWRDRACVQEENVEHDRRRREAA